LCGEDLARRVQSPGLLHGLPATGILEKLLGQLNTAHGRRLNGKNGTGGSGKVTGEGEESKVRTTTAEEGGRED
jgi:hypothetical protein